MVDSQHDSHSVEVVAAVGVVSEQAKAAATINKMMNICLIGRCSVGGTGPV